MGYLQFSPSPPRSVSLLLHSTRSTLEYPQWLTIRENNNTRRRAKTESEAGHFMDSKENKLYYSIQLELLRLKHLTKICGEEQSPKCTECVYVPSYIHWAIMILLYISFWFFFFNVAFCVMIIHYFWFLNVNSRLNSVC